MAEAEQNFVNNNEQQNCSLPTFDQHDLTVDELNEQVFAGDIQNECNFPKHDVEDQNLDGCEQVFMGNEPESNFEMISDQNHSENENEPALDGEEPDQGLDGVELKQELNGNEANEMDDAPDIIHVHKKEERENNSVPGTEVKKWSGWPGDSVFRMLVPGQKVGNIIGRKGEYIKKIVEETRARVKVLDGPPGSQERAVMVSAKEEPDASLPPAIVGLLRVHSRIVDGLDGDSSQASPAGAKVSTKFLMPGNQAGNLIGKQGATVKSIQENSGCIVRVLGQESRPAFALEDDRVVEVVGEPAVVHKAVELIAQHLRKYLVDRSVISIFEKQMQAASARMDQMPPHPGPWGPPQGLPFHGGLGHGYGAGPQYMPPPPRQHDNYYPPIDVPPHQGISAYGLESSVSSHAPSSVQSAPSMTTQHMQVPLQYADAVIGSNGSTISYVRRASGATVTIQETRGVPGEMTVEINGNASQVQAAQQLVQNFMADAASSAAASTAAPAVAPTQTGGSTDQAYSQGYSSYAAAPAQTGGAMEQAYSQGYSSYAAPAPVYGSQPSAATQPGAYGSAYGGNYGY